MATSSQKSTKAPYTVVLGIDYSESSALALAEAVRLARAAPASQIHVVHATPLAAPAMQMIAIADPTLAYPTASPQQLDELSRAVSLNLEAYVSKELSNLVQADATTVPEGAIQWLIHVRRSDPVHAIVQLASDLAADLIVIGTHSRTGLERFLVGSVAEGVVRIATCPVLVVRPSGAQSASQTPKIEPPCPDCVEARRASAGAELWCARHREHHPRAHTYHFASFRDAHQSGLLLHPVGQSVPRG